MKRIVLALFLTMTPVLTVLAAECAQLNSCCCGGADACPDQGCGMAPVQASDEALPSQEAPAPKVSLVPLALFAEASLEPASTGSHSFAMPIHAERGSPPRAVLVSFQL